MTTKHYIQSIDGLRALAVSLVLLYHLDIQYFDGGFIGVDVFFVISGYLITRNISRATEEQTFKFKDFYIRRAARLFPALFVTIALTLVASFFILSPPALIEAGKSALASTLFLANYYFESDSGYFDAASHVKPLLHTWSLSVEEQFYLIWPITLVMLITYAKHAKVMIIGLIGLTSLGAALWYESTNPSAVFYLTPFRIFQFSIGANLALLGTSKSNKFIQPVGIAAFLGLIGLSVWVSFGLKGVAATALLPAILTGLFLWSSQSKVSLILFGAKPLVWIGKRSYSIYLTHWPVIVLYKIKMGYELSIAEQFGLGAVSVLAGALLYKSIESPIRIHSKSTLGHIRKKLIATGSLGLASVVIAGALIRLDGFPSRVPEDIQAALTDAKTGMAERVVLTRSGTCHILRDENTLEDWKKNTCHAPISENPRILVVGDSFAGGTYLIFKDAFPNISFGQLSIPGCRLRRPTRFTSEKTYKTCKDLYQHFLENIIYENDYDAVILTSNWLPDRLEELDEILKALEAAGMPTILIGSRPMFAEPMPDILGKALSLTEAAEIANSGIPPYIFRLNDRMKKKYATRTFYVDMMNLTCPNKCDVFNENDELLILDKTHFSRAGITLLSDRLSENYGDSIMKWLEQASSKRKLVLLKCSSIGVAPAFERELSIALRNNEVWFQRGISGQQGFEIWHGTKTSKGKFDITGHYIEGLGGMKQLAFSGIMEKKHVQATGMRGPRVCEIESINPID